MFGFPTPPPPPLLLPHDPTQRRAPSCAGMPYEMASRRGHDLVKQAAETGAWVAIIDELSDLHKIIERAYR